VTVESLNFEQMQFDSNYGLLSPEETVIIRTYTDDTDDQVLAEIRPRFIIFYEPNLDFVRRVEVPLIIFLIVPVFKHIFFRFTAIPTRDSVSECTLCIML
jgi:hypothetical protein